MSDNTYNGWSNYATWRINLELLGNYDFAEDILESDNESWRPDVDYLKDLVENWVFENHTGSLGLVEDYARAFVEQVNFHEILGEAKKNGFSEADPTNDIEGIDAAHKLSLLSGICFATKINFNNIKHKGISDIQIEDINNAKKLGYKIKLIATSEIINNSMLNVVEPTLVHNTSQLSNVDGVLNGIKIQTDHLSSLFLEGQAVFPKKLIDHHFEFKCIDIDNGIRSVIKG